MSSADPPARTAHDFRCANCGAPLAADQRYCLSCGTRRGTVPAAVAGTLAALTERSRVPPPPAAAAPLLPSARRMLDALSPRAAAVAVMSTLAFGVVVGSGASSLAQGSNPILIAVSHPAAAASPASSVSAAAASQSSGSSGSGGSGGRTVTQTIAAQTVTAPSSSTGGGGGGGGGSGSGSSPSLPPVKHVFLIMLSGQGYQHSFGPESSFPYLSKTLRRQGELITNYYGVASSSLANSIALISGQGPTQQTVANCPTYENITPATKGSEGQVMGDGCVYPTTTETLPQQLTDGGYSWKAYVESINDAPTGTPKSCRHPTLGAADPSSAPQPGDPYVTWRNPFVYFQGLTADATCATTDVGLPQLTTDLKSAAQTPSLAYIVPSVCDDGSETVCPAGPAPASSGTTSTSASTTAGDTPAGEANAPTISATDTTTTTPTTTTTSTTSTTTTPTTSTTTTPSPTTSSTTTTTSTPATTPTLTTAPANSPQAKVSDTATDNFLKSVVPEIERSKAYKSGGLIAITFDQAPQTGPNADQTSCCGNPTYPNLPATTTTGTTTTGTTTSGSATTTGTSSTTTTSSSTTGTTSTGTSSTGSSTSTGTTPTGTPPGGGQVGLLLISHYVKPNSEDVVAQYNHYSLLASIEQLFSLDRLGYAKNSQVPVFDSAIYNAYTGTG